MQNLIPSDINAQLPTNDIKRGKSTKIVQLICLNVSSSTLKLILRGIRTSGDLLTGGLKTCLAYFVKGSFVSPKLSIFMPKTHRAMTSIVNALNCLFHDIRSEQFQVKSQLFELINSLFGVEFSFRFSQVLKSFHPLVSTFGHHHRHLKLEIKVNGYF